MNTFPHPKVGIERLMLIDNSFFVCLFLHMNRVNVVQWSEDLYEKQLIERTIDACGGTVDIVIDYGTTSRSLHRSIQCLSKNGVALVSEEVGERLLPKFSSLAEKREVKLRAVANGTIEQLKQLVQLVAKREVSSNPSHLIPFRLVHVIQSNFWLFGIDNLFPLYLFIHFVFNLWSIPRLNHHHTQCSHSMMLKMLSVNYANPRFPAAPYSNSTISSNFIYAHTQTNIHTDTTHTHKK